MKLLLTLLIMGGTTLLTTATAQTDVQPSTLLEKQTVQDEHSDEDEHADEGEHTDEDEHADEGEHTDGDEQADEGEHTDGDEHADEGEHADEKPLELSAQSIAMANISVSALSLEQLLDSVSAPGEVQLNQYTSADVAPLVDAVVVERHAQLGDAVVANQRLVTLASVEVAGAQGQLRIASAEWQRSRKLGKATVGAKRYTEAEVAYEQAKLTLSAYGLDDKQIDAITTRNQKGALGRFELSAPLPGTVLLDDFRIGQRIEAGQRLFLIADESQIWIEANLSPDQANSVSVGISVRVKMGGHWHNGKVIQKHHLLDEQTRTVPLRIAVEPDGEHHHAGEFVQVSIDLVDQAEGSSMTLVVPESALMQDDEQNWTVFVEVESGHYQQTVVNRGVSRGDRVAISGLDEGTRVVTSGAFFLAAELAKSGFDIHNH